MRLLDPPAHLDSVVHRLAAGWKLSAAAGLVLAAALVPPAWGWLLAVLATAPIAAAIGARLPWRFLAVRMLLLEPLAAGLAVLALFQPQGHRAAFWLLARSTLCLLTLTVLAGTTPFPEILAALRRVRTPSLLLTTLALLHRYLPLMVDESRRMSRARTSRTFRAGRAAAWWSQGGVVARLFVRCLDRAERIYAAMAARGWQ